MRKNTIRYIIMLYLPGLLASLLVGCNAGTMHDAPGGTFTVIARNKASGEAVNDFLLIQTTEKSNTKTEPLCILPQAHAEMWYYRVTDTNIRRLDSKQEFYQKPLSHTDKAVWMEVRKYEQRYRYWVVKRGYIVYWSCIPTHDTDGYFISRIPKGASLEFSLRPYVPGSPCSRVWSVKIIRDLFDDVVPYLDPADPNTREILTILREQLEDATHAPEELICYPYSVRAEARKYLTGIYYFLGEEKALADMLARPGQPVGKAHRADPAELEAQISRSIAIVQDGSVNCYERSVAIDCLEYFRSPRAIKPLVDLLQTDKKFRDEQEEFSYKYDAAWTLSKILENVKDPVAVKRMVKRLESGKCSLQEKRLTIDVLGHSRDPQALGILIKLTTSDQPSGVRVAAAQALGRLKQPAGAKRLIEMLKGSDEEVRSWAARALGEMKDSASVSLLLRRLEEAKCTQKEKAEIIYALGQIGDRRAVAPLLQMLDHETGDVLSGTVRALGSIGDRRATKPICGMFEKVPYYVSVRALRDLKDPNAVEPLITWMKRSHDFFVRQEIIGVLGEIGDRRAVEPLLQELPKPSAMVALAKLKDPRAVEPLINAAAKQVVEDGSLSYCAVIALDELNDPRAIPVLLDSLEKLPCLGTADALYKITGMHLGFKASVWRKWWKKQKAANE